LLRWGRSLGLFAAILAAACSPQSDQARSVGDPYPNASEVRLFVETGYDDEGEPILASAKGRTLTEGERRAFEGTLRIEPAPDEVTACFIPHHFFAYFDARGRKIGEIAVCFCCAGVSATPSGAISLDSDEMLSADYAALETLVKGMDQPTQVACE
jgi:hypothetical protein